MTQSDKGAKREYEPILRGRGIQGKGGDKGRNRSESEVGEREEIQREVGGSNATIHSSWCVHSPSQDQVWPTRSEPGV